ncbi:MAG: glycine cleavage system aminomethyltransferase GcvT [Cyclobacteriaceae bacterium]|nr:glycine cleavage system aminomethyltransferase GcvT [Cyclobacteriaceae bacterium]
MQDIKLPLHQRHEELGGKIIPFAGFLMPVRYSSDKDEHNTVREKVGIFDVSHMGEFKVTGSGSLEFLQYITSNDVSRLVPGMAQYSCLPNENGGIVDDLIVYMIDTDHYFLVVNAGNIEKDWNWISQYKNDNVVLENVSDNYCLFAIQGPLAEKTLQKLTDTPLSTIKYYHFMMGNLTGIHNVMISATGYTGAGGFEVYLPKEKALEVWNSILKVGEEFGIKPIGLGARDTLRMEMGFCLYGNDINDTTSPIEAGLGWITKFSKDFIGKAVIEKVKEQGPTKKLVGFKMQERGIPRSGYKIVDGQGNEIGEVTSGTMSPSMDVGIGLGYVKVEYMAPDTDIFIDIRNKHIKAKIHKLPLLTS